MKKHPGTAGSMPVKGTGCGIRPDLDELGADTGFDFSAARTLLQPEQKPDAEEPELSRSTEQKQKPDQ